MPVAECVADTRAEDRERGCCGNGRLRPGAIDSTPRRAAGESRRRVAA